MSYGGLFLSSSKASSTIQDSLQSCDLHEYIQCLKRTSTWFCNTHVSFIGHVVCRICRCRYKCTAQKVHYQPDTNNRCDYRCITRNMCKITVDSQVGLMDIQGLIFSQYQFQENNFYLSCWEQDYNQLHKSFTQHNLGDSSQIYKTTKTMCFKESWLSILVGNYTNILK